MESTISKPSSSANEKNEWFLVQYEQSHHIITGQMFTAIKVVRSETIPNIDELDLVLTNDRGIQNAVYKLYRTKRYEDAVEKYQYIEKICTESLYLPPETNNVETMCPKNNFWVIVKYRTMAANGKDEESNLGIFHRTQIELKRDYNSNNFIGFIEENKIIYNGPVLRASYDVQVLENSINNTKIDILKSFKEYIGLQNEEKKKMMIKELSLEKEKMQCQHEELKTILKTENEKIKILKQRADQLNKLVNNFKSKDKVKENAVKNYWQSILSKLPDYSPEDS